MARFGKWIGGGLGWAFGGPIGALMGFMFGSIVDSMNSGSHEYKETQAGDFTASIIILSAAIMKADDKVMKSELEYVKRFFLHNFGLENTQKMMLYLKEIQKAHINLPAVCEQIDTYMDYSAKLQLLHFLFGIAGADNNIDKSEENLINEISNRLNIKSADFSSIKNMFITAGDNLEQAYKILEIKNDASIEEIKKAYRRMAVKYHPDKVIHLGEKYQKAATEKFQQVNNAYEKIKKQRDFV
ncbi:MAG: TerB family tellurite resistance protein [Bacteroidales bacterium]|nr:TerB family tellurite resistance protein [Bacteroidales bacterium]